MRAICDEFGIMMIADEVMAGFGRAGEWFAVDHWGVTPDLITFAKGVNSGYVPLGGVLISDAIAATFQERAYPGGLTYSGHPLACGSAVASINIFKEEGIVEHARALGTDVIGPELAKLADKHPSVGEVRGLGVFWALELVRDRATREPLVPFNAAGADAKPMAEFAAACRQRGLWPFVHFNRTHVVPPCTTTADEVREGIAILDEALEVADGRLDYTGRCRRTVALPASSEAKSTVPAPARVELGRLGVRGRRVSVCPARAAMTPAWKRLVAPTCAM